MDDLISRQAAIEGLKDYFYDEARTETEYGAYWHHIHVLQFLEDISPADVRPVVRGRWVKNDENPLDGTFYCSNCKGGINIADGDITPLDLGMYYCHKCGADMRGGDAE